MLMNPPYTLVRNDHYVVTNDKRVTFGLNLPLTQRAAKSFAKQYGGRVILRPTARKRGLFPKTHTV
jgi:nitrous oxide reductase accessory protein NosL